MSPQTWILVVALASTTAVGVLWEMLRRALDASQARAAQSEHLFSRSFFKSPVPLALTTIDTREFVEVNDAYAALVGWTRDELIGHTSEELGITSSEHSDRLHRRLARGAAIRDLAIAVIRKDAAKRDVVLTSDVVVIDGASYVLTTAIDETERKRTEAALHATDARLRELAETIDEVFWVATPDGAEILYASPAFERLWGRPVESFGMRFESLLSAVHPDDRSHLAQTFDGAQPDRVEREYRIVRPDGTIRWARSRSGWVCDEDGRVVRRAGVTFDITEQRALEERLRHAQKMESLGQLAGGIAHDFNNLLAAISSCNGLLGESIPADSPDRELVADIDSAVARAVQLTRQLLTFSRKQVAAPEVVDLNAVVKETRNMLSRIVGADIALTMSLDPEAARVRIDPGSLVQVVMNLALNARDAMAHGGTLALATRAIDIAPHGPVICLSVSDDGCGMSDEVRARVFEPFFTTKERGKGTGLGLAVAYGIVEQASGRIEVDSKLGAGTTFRVYLPAVRVPAQTMTEVPAPLQPGCESILLVDDDDYVRRGVARALRARGYQVVEARDGETALRALDERTPDLLVTDVVMPGIDGRELAERACARAVGLKVLFMSGYTEDEVVRRGVLNGKAVLLQKPFRVPALAAKVREVLDGAAAPLLMTDRLRVVRAPVATR
jgi:two-component system cell cycle sensor histidine kinase/response regulator CckA